MKHALLILLAVLLLFLTGCQTLTMSEQEKVGELKALGVDPESQGSRGPWATAFGNVFLGMGNLANGQAGLFAVDLMTWPVSILWSPAVGYNQAHVLNQKETVDYFYETRGGRAHIAAIRRGVINPKTPSPLQMSRQKGRPTWPDY